MYNNEAILPNWTEEFIRVATIIGTSNVFLSVFENGLYFFIVVSCLLFAVCCL